MTIVEVSAPELFVASVRTTIPESTMLRFALALLSAVALVASVSPVIANEVDEHRHQAASLRERASDLREDGHVKDAEQLQREAEEHEQIAKQLEAKARGKRPIADGPIGKTIDFDAEIGKRELLLQGLMEKLARSEEAGASEPELNELREQAERARQELDRLRSERERNGHNRHTEMSGPVRQLRHAREGVRLMREASEHFASADIREIAVELRRHADEIDRHVSEREKQVRREMEQQTGGRDREHLQRQIEELQAQVKRIQAELEARDREK